MFHWAPAHFTLSVTLTFGLFLEMKQVTRATENIFVNSEASVTCCRLTDQHETDRQTDRQTAVRYAAWPHNNAHTGTHTHTYIRLC